MDWLEPADLDLYGTRRQRRRGLRKSGNRRTTMRADETRGDVSELTVPGMLAPSVPSGQAAAEPGLGAPVEGVGNDHW